VPFGGLSPLPRHTTRPLGASQKPLIVSPSLRQTPLCRVRELIRFVSPPSEAKHETVNDFTYTNSMINPAMLTAQRRASCLDRISERRSREVHICHHYPCTRPLLLKFLIIQVLIFTFTDRTKCDLSALIRQFHWPLRMFPYFVLFFCKRNISRRSDHQRNREILSDTPLGGKGSILVDLPASDLNVYIS
jgi:hypothetical protein